MTKSLSEPSLSPAAWQIIAMEQIMQTLSHGEGSLFQLFLYGRPLYTVFPVPRFCSAITVWQDKVRHVGVNGAAFNKDYCRGQRDNKRELCGAADNMIGQISNRGSHK